MDAKKVRLAIAPIGWTNDDMPELGGGIPFEQCVSEMALAGFSGCEVGGKFPRDTTVLGKALALRGLSVCNAWFSMHLTSKPFEETLELFRDHCAFLRAVGAGLVGVAEQGGSIQGDPRAPVFDAKPVFDEAAWKRLIGGIVRLAPHAAEFGMRIVYHHHMGTGVQTTAEVDRLLTETPADALGLLYDTGHLAMSGEDHLAVLRKWLPRIAHVHLKDIRRPILSQVKAEKLSFLDAVRAGVFTVPGDGDIDFAPVFAALDRGGYEGWMVVEAEQDPAKANPLEYAMKARRYIREQAQL